MVAYAQQNADQHSLTDSCHH